MRYRRFGRTGLEISELIFGGGAVGGILIDADDDTRRTAVKMALDAGVNWIDTAAKYGNGRSEQALAWLMAELPEERRPHISTKLTFDREAGDFAGQAERSMTESLERLKMDSVALFQVHNRIASSPERIEGALTPNDLLRKGGVADALQGLVDKGLTRYIGITATGETGPLHEVIASQRFDTAQIYYNLLNPSAGMDVPSGFSAYDHKNLIKTAADNDVGVIVIRVLAAGVIATDRRTGKEGGVILDNDVAADEARMRKVLPLLKPEHGARSQVAFRYALRNPGVSGIEVGIAELEHLRLAIEAAEMGPLPDDLLAELDALVARDFA
ncbi:MAG: aldo/keto reductase [Gammaproteobacteria bacterium]|nr:aldo/keto reductase [Gammaproteobacteria bacterium]